MNIKAAGVEIIEEFGSGIGRGSGVGGWTANSLVSLALNVGTLIAGVILVFLLIGGGVKIIQGAGSGDSKSASQGQQAITWAIAGFLVVVFAYWGIRLIETIVGVNFTTNPVSPVGP